MLRTKLPILLLLLAIPSSTETSQAQSVPADLPSFEVATIKSPAPGADRKGGFYGEPGGRVFVGGTVRMLVMIAFNLRSDQIVGDRDWAASDWFEVDAVPPESSPSRHISVGNNEPTLEQRQMLQSLLHDRFEFQSHFEAKEGDVYVLTRGNKAVQFKPPKNSAADPRAVVVIKEGGIADGEAEGINTTTDYLAQRLGRYLGLPVLNETGITGSYDFELLADNPENSDVVSAVQSVVNRLGLKLKRTRGSIQTLVIDHIQRPSQN